LESFILSEQRGEEILPITWSLLHAASKLSDDIKLICCGNISKNSLEMIQSYGVVKEIIILDSSIPEYVADYCTRFFWGEFRAILAAENNFILPRIAALVDRNIITKVNEIDNDIGCVISGNLKLSIPLNGVCIAIDTSYIAGEITNRNIKSSIFNHKLNIKADYRIFYDNLSQDSKKVNLSNAEIVVAGGRALTTTSDYNRLKLFADKVRGALGCTYSAVAAGILPVSCQIGISGANISPKLYLAFGISGSIQHLAGICKSSTIVAINNDPDAEIFKVADYGVLMDWDEALTELEVYLDKE
jgi:electron transfer flavoprotein alpha subunit